MHADFCKLCNHFKIPIEIDPGWSEDQIKELYSLDKFTLDDIQDSQLSFLTPAFLIEFIRNIINLKKSNPHLNWPRLHLMTKKIIYPKEITTGVAKNVLQGLIKTMINEDAKKDILAGENGN